MKTTFARYLLPLMTVSLLIALMNSTYRNYMLRKERLERKEQVLEQYEVALNAFGLAYEDLQGHVLKLLDMQAGVRSDLMKRQSEIRELQSDIQEIREWAIISLPDDIVRLRKRQTIVGASAYREYMSQSGTVRTDSQQPEEQWRLKSAD